MKEKRRILAAVLAVFAVVALFAACQPKTEPPEVTAAPEDTAAVNQGWNGVVSTASTIYRTPLSDQQVKGIINTVLAQTRAAQSGGTASAASWDGSYASLTQEERRLVEEAIKENTGYDVAVSDEGLTYLETESTTGKADAGTQAGTATAATTTTKTTTTQKNSTAASAPLVQTTGEGNLSLATDTTAKSADAPTLLSAKRVSLNTFGGKGHQRLVKGASTANGGYAVLALVDSAAPDHPGGFVDYSTAILQYSPAGKLEWKRYFGGNAFFELADIAILKDGSIVAVGSTKATNLDCATSDGSNSDGVMIKLDSSGKLLWMKSVYGSKEDQLLSVAATPDGGFLVGGTTTSADQSFNGMTDYVDRAGSTVTRVVAHKAFLLKYDKDASTVYWKRAMTGSRSCSVLALAVDSAGDVYASIRTYAGDYDFAGIAGMGYEDGVMMSLTKNGETRWLKPFASISHESITALVPAPGGGVAAVGYVGSASYGSGSFQGNFGSSFGVFGGDDAVALKYNSDGSVAWIRTIGDRSNDTGTGIAAVEGGYVVTGTSYASVDPSTFRYDWLDQPFGGDQDGFAMLLKENGGPVKFIPVDGAGKDNLYAVAGKGRNFALIGSSPSEGGFFADANPKGSGYNHVGFLALYQEQWSA
ncbi:MAG: hypothetical protein LBQ33_05440 [Oscillospiraceae bacterium]|jgi:hypothetical protein|nr:hypothetical protein [Oscillospiraceae bacterium]